MPANNTGHRALPSLDASKAFHSIDWWCLWAVLDEFGFGARFVSWVCLSNHASHAAIRNTERVSDTFVLGRGTKQGFSLSLLLFAIAIEPLAALICTNLKIIGFIYGNLHGKIMLYDDDMLLL